MRTRPRSTARLAPAAAGLAAGLALVTSCATDRPGLPTAPQRAEGPAAVAPVFVDRSVTPALVKNVMPGVTVTTLLSSDDDLPGSPGYVFGGSADGAGLLRNPDGGYTLLVNNEDNWSVSRVTLDATFKPVAGEYVVNSDDGMARLCSATLATPAEHGFGPLFLTAGESSEESMSRAVDAFGGRNTSRPLTAFGRWSAENVVPLPRSAYPGKTVVVIGDDDSGTYGGQVALYVSNTVGDLDGGNLYVLTRSGDATRETRMRAGVRYPVTFKQLENQQAMTGRQLNVRSRELGAVAFGRVEDVDYRKGGGGNGREVFFNVTGQNNTGVNADYSRSKYGRVYRLTLDPADPLRGTLEVVLDGDDRAGPARAFENVDNVVATEHYLYLEEDPNEYGDETHDSYLYQYNLATKELKVVLELDHRRDRPDAAKYNVGGPSPRGSWENSGILDVSEQTGVPGTFVLGVQAHTWRGARYLNPDGGALRASENQASQLLVLSGLPR